jgi:hypothetical protein
MAETIFGAVLILLVLFDVFQSIIVPRATPRAFRLSPILVRDTLWPICHTLANERGPLARFRQSILNNFAPAAFLFLIITWLFVMVLGFALIFYGIRADLKPAVTNFPDAFYFAGTSVLTLGFGDVVAAGQTARFVVLLAALSGLTFMAMAVSFLFTIQSILQQREQVVNTIISRAGAPASGLVMLMRYKELKLMTALGNSFTHWESWVAGILESHSAYPILMYFRSTSNTDSWLSVLGAMLDASSLIITSIDNISIGEAELFYWLSCSMVRAFTSRNELQCEEGPSMSFSDFQQALYLLRESGYETIDETLAWKRFSIRRSGYIGHINALATFYEMPSNAWIHQLAVAQLQVKVPTPGDSIFQPRV